MKIEINKKKINVKVCKHFFSKAIGLMGKKNIKNGILLIRCNSIHTFFMRSKIDILMTDKNFKVLYIYKSFKKNKIIWPKKNVYYTFELPEKTIKNIKRNEYLKTED